MKKLTNFFNFVANGLQKTGGGNSQLSLRSEGARSTLAGHRLSNTLITHESPTNHPLKQSVWKVAAVLLMVFMVGIGNAWGAINNTTVTKAGGSQKYIDVTTTAASNGDEVTVSKQYIAYTISELISNSIKDVWYTQSSSGSGSSNSDAVDFTGYRSTCNKYIGLSSSKKYTHYVTNCVSFSVLYSPQASGRYCTITATNVDDGTDIVSVSNSGDVSSSTKYNIELTGLSAAKYYRVVVETNNSNDSRIYQIRLGAYVNTTGPYAITYDKNDEGASGTMTDSSSPYTKNSTVTVLANSFTAPTGKVFKEWNTKADGTGLAYDPDDTFSATEDVKLYAQWGYPPTGTGTITYTLTKQSAAVSGSVSGVSTISGFSTSIAQNILTINTSGNGKDNYAGRCQVPAGTAFNSSNYYDVQFEVASGYKFTPSSLSVMVNPFTDTGDMKVKVELKDEQTTPVSVMSNELACAKSTDNEIVFADDAFDDVELKGTVHIRIYMYGPSNAKTCYIKSPITVSGTVASEGGGECTDADPELAYETAAVEKTNGDAKFTNALTNSHNVTVSYESSDEDVAEVDENGEVTIKTYGEVTITASNEAGTYGGTDYCADEASYTLTINKRSYAISYAAGDAEGVTGSKTAESKTEDEAFALPSSAVFEREGYVQQGWNTSSNGTSGEHYDLGGSYTTNAAQTFYPEWTTAHTLTYNANGGTGSMSNTVGAGTVTLRANAYTKDGYVFAGWATSQANADAGTIAYADRDANYNLSADATLYAVWYTVYYSFTPKSVASSEELAVDDVVATSTGAGSMTVLSTPATYQTYGLELGYQKEPKSAGSYQITLTDDMTAGTIMAFTLYMTGTNNNRGLKLNNSSDQTKATFNFTADGNDHNFTYTTIADDGFVGAKIIKLIRTNTTAIKSIKIAKWVAPDPSCAATVPGNISKGTATGGTGTITLTAAGEIASGDAWYWQSAEDGTDKTGTSGATKSVNAAGTYYVRSYNTAGDCWSAAKSVEVEAADLLTAISPTLSYDANVIVGNTASPTLEGNAGSGSVTYALNDVTPAGSLTINESTGVVTAVTVGGTATVTATIAANGNYAAGEATSGTITVLADPVGSGHVLTWPITTVSGSSESNVSDGGTTDIGTGTPEATSTYITNQTDLTGVGVKRKTTGKKSNTGKIETPDSYDADKYVSFTFDVADGYQFTPSAVSIKTVAVSTKKDLKFELSDAGGSYSVTKTDLSTDATAAENELDFSECTRAFTGTVTVKIYVYGATDQYRLSTPLTITGTVAEIPACAGYEFHYGTKNQNNWKWACFEQVGETNEWRVANFTIPSTTHYYVGYHGDGVDGWNSTWSAEKQWTDTYSDGNGAMVLLPGTSAVGQATGAQGSLIIWNNSSDKNKYVGFKPNGYGITYGGNSHAFAATATANVWETGVVTLPDVSTNYTMGLATATENTYVACAHSADAEAISNMGVSILDGGKKKLYLNAGVWRTEEGTGEKIAIFDFTDDRNYWGANDNSFMTYNSTLGLYEGYVLSDATDIIFVRINKNRETPAWGEDISWNQTANITLGSLANTYAITGWTDGTDGKSGHSVTPIHPATGQKGKFRIWDNSSAQNWYVHFVPYYTLSYNGNGGSGEMAATERSAESASTTVTVAANGFTAPACKHFAGWAISQEHADAGTVDYAAGADYTLTADATLFAVWETTYAQSIDLATYAGSHSGTAWQGYLNDNGYSYVLGSEEGAEISLDNNNAFDTGLKLKNSTTSNISFVVAAGKMIKIVTGKVNGLSIAINGGAATAIPSGTDATHLATSYYYNAAAQNVVIRETNTSYNIIREISIENPYTVTYNANGGEDVAAATFYGTALTLPSASKGTDSFLGWFTEETGGTKIGEAGGSYTPSASIELFAHWEAVSTDARLASITFSSNAGTLEPAFDPEVVNYTYTMPYGTAAVPTITGATAVNAGGSYTIVSQAEAWNETAVIRGVAASSDTKQYNITMKIAPKDGVSLIKVATTGGTNKTVTGAYAGDGDVNLSSGDKARKMDKGKYIGFTLDGTTLQAGDRINVHTTQAANNSGSHIIFYDNMTDKNKLYDTEAIGGTGNNIFTINAAMVGATTAYVYRSSDDAPDNWNGFVDYIEVTRAMNPVLTAISFNSVAATKGTGTTFSVELPNGTTLGTMTVEPTVIRNAAHATTPQAVITNEGAWAWGENTYRVMDKDNDYTDYTITLTEALAPAETPVIATQPADASFCAGGSAALSVAVNDVSDGGTLSYAWFKKGSPDEAVGTNSDSYAATAVGTYYVKVTNTTAGKAPVTVQSEDADVTLNVAATITTQPESQDYIVSGSQVSLSVVASNATGYQWYSCEDAEKTNAAVIPGEDEANYTFTCAADGYYYCVVGNACGDDIASDVVSVKLEPQGCNAIASIPSEKPYQYVQTGEWTLYGIDSDGRINGSNKFVNNAKDFNNNTVNAITDQRVGIIFDKDVESITIYATATSTGRAWKSDQQIRVTSDAITEGVNPKPVYTNVSATRTVTTMPGENKQYIFTAEDMLLEAGKKVWLPFSGELTIFRICYTAAPEKCAAPVLPALASKELCAGVSEAWDATATVSDEGTLSYQWYNADTDEAIEGAEDAEFTPSEDGNYYVIVTNSKTGYRDNSTKSATLSVEHFEAAEITTAPYNQRAETGSEATLTVAATGKNVTYKWYTCDDEAGTNPVEITPAETGTSLTVTVTENMEQWYKVVVSSDCGSASAVAKIEQFVPVAQANVTNSILWDWKSSTAGWPSEADQKIQFANTSVEYLMANVDGRVPNNEGFRSDMLIGKGQYLWRNTGEGEHGFQGLQIKFHTEVAGKVRIYYRAPSSGNTCTVTIDEKSAGSRGNSWGWSEYVDVDADNDIVINMVNSAGADKFTRVQKIEFLKTIESRSGYAANALGTACYEDDAMVTGATVYELQGANENGYMVFDEITSGEIEAGKPYLFEATGTGNVGFYKKVNATHADEAGSIKGMYGTFAAHNLQPGVEDYYYFSGRHIWEVNAFTVAYITIPAHRCYVDYTEFLNNPVEQQAPAPGRRRVMLGVNGTNNATGLENAEASEGRVQKVLIDGKIYILRGEKIFDATGRLVK